MLFHVILISPLNEDLFETRKRARQKMLFYVRLKAKLDGKYFNVFVRQLLGRRQVSGEIP
jgi:hypothetical protein